MLYFKVNYKRRKDVNARKARNRNNSHMQKQLFFKNMKEDIFFGDRLQISLLILRKYETLVF